MKKLLYSLVVIVLLATACSDQGATATPNPSPTPKPTDTSLPPTATPIPPTATPQPTPTEPPPIASATPAPTATPTEIPVERFTHIAYADEDDDGSRKLDIYLPGDQDGPFPTILVIPGIGQNRAIWADYGRYFARRGYALLVISYRGKPGYTYPLPVEDAFCALGWLHANADVYGFDTEHVFVTGFWFGATQGALIGSVDDPSEYLSSCPHSLPDTDWIRGTMMICGTFDYTHEALRSGQDASVPRSFGGPYEETKELWEEGSPITWADSDDPPLLWVCGADTQSTVYAMGDTFSVLLADIESTIKQTGIAATVVLLPDLDVTSLVDEQIYAAMEEFLMQHQD